MGKQLDQLIAEEEANKVKREAERIRLEKENYKNAVTNYKADDFNFSENNPYLNAVKGNLSQSNVDARENMARELASRGGSNSGMAVRASARGQQQLGQQMANVTGQDYLRQLNQYTNEEQTKYNRMLNNYNISNQEYESAKNEYYQTLAIQQQNAMLEYQKEQDSGFNWGNAISGAASLGKTGFELGGPWGAVAGAGLGMLGGLS